MLKAANGGLGRIRTPDPLIRSQVLYPTELPDHLPSCERRVDNLLTRLMQAFKAVNFLSAENSCAKGVDYPFTFGS